MTKYSFHIRLIVRTWGFDAPDIIARFARFAEDQFHYPELTRQSFGVFVGIGGVLAVFLSEHGPRKNLAAPVDWRGQQVHPTRQQ